MTRKIALVGVLGAAVFSAGILGITGAHAQDAAAKKAATKVKFQPWIKLCPQKVKGGQKKICMVRADYLDRIGGRPYAPVSIEQVEGEKERLVVILPHIWLLPAKVKNKEGKEVMVARPVPAQWNIAAGAQIKVDDGKSYKLGYTHCYNFGCIAQMEINPELITALKKGNKILVAGVNGVRPLGLAYTLDGFSKAYDGKALSHEVYEKSWKKKLITLHQQRLAAMKKQQELMKKAQQKKK